jgi:exosortase
VTSSESEPQKKSLPYGLLPHEVGGLILLGAALYFCQDQYWRNPLPLYLFSAATLGAVGILSWRCQTEWRQLPNKWFWGFLTAAWVTLFGFWGNPTFSDWDSRSLPVWMFDMYTSPALDEGHGLLIPFVVLALFWWKRKELLAKPPGLWWPALGLIGLALCLHIVGFKSQQQRLSIMAFFLGLYALTGLAWGWHWLKASFFPFFLLGFCIPVAEYSVSLTLPLRLLVSRIVEIIAHFALAPDLKRVGTQLFDSVNHSYAYEVAAPCSGIHSLVALVALATILGFVNHQSAWKRALMMLIAVPLAVLQNVLRLCFTIVVAESFGQNAGKAVETDTGYFTFALAIACEFWVSRWLEAKAGAGRTLPGQTQQPPLESGFTDKPVTP